MGTALQFGVVLSDKQLSVINNYNTTLIDSSWCTVTVFKPAPGYKGHKTLREPVVGGRNNIQLDKHDLTCRGKKSKSLIQCACSLLQHDPRLTKLFLN